MKVLCKVSYDGSFYFGYQKQNNQITIQEVIENVLKKITKKEINIYASGRTDAKVHAYGQMFHFESDLNMSELNWEKALNSLLPKDIRIIKVFFVEEDFHARFSVIKKNYIYKMNLGKYDLFNRNYIAQLNYDLDLTKLNEVSKLFIGEHDYRNFCSNNEDNDDYVRNIYSIDIQKENDLIYISFKGSGFKRYMIRMIVGTMIEYARNRIDLNYITTRLDTNEINKTQYKALAEGLYLNKVYYGRSDIDED